MSIVRSPLFYVGDKYKLMPQLKELFPQNINRYIEPFCGGGSSFLNTKAKKYLLNDIDENIIALHKFLNVQSKNSRFFDEVFELINYYLLSCSYKNFIPPLELRQKHKKTYFAKFNKESYAKLKMDYNANKSDILRLYLLLIYGFNHMLRFNLKGEFNLPVGNVDFNANVKKALRDYFSFSKNAELEFHNLDFVEFIKNIEFQSGDFIYLDLPYLISNSEYNKLWNEINEMLLYEILDNLDKKGVKWGLTNLAHHKEKSNNLLISFAKKYHCYDIKSNYISFNDNTIKTNSKEVYITNAKPRIQNSLF